MRKDIAEQLLRKVLGWDESKSHIIMQQLRFLAAVNYDEYKNFEPGMRFIESLSYWLHQFKTLEERKKAFKFVNENLVFISETQMEHLVTVAYYQRVLPILLDIVSKQEDIPAYRIKTICSTQAFKVMLRKSLFVGLSDGARIGSFRRKHYLNNEQVIGSYEISQEKCNRLVTALKEWLKNNKIDEDPSFNNIFLIDDFTASGTNIIRQDKEGDYDGKLKRFLKDCLGEVKDQKNLGLHCAEKGVRVYIFTYVGASGAIAALRERIKGFIASNKKINVEHLELLDPILKLPDEIRVRTEHDFYSLLEKYYDPKLEDETTRTGGTDIKLGYAGCALPVVLSHNCPNNSVFLLWAQQRMIKDKLGVRALFPRISRHREEK